LVAFEETISTCNDSIPRKQPPRWETPQTSIVDLPFRITTCFFLMRSIRLVWVTLVALQILLNDKYKLNHCKEMGAEPGRRFLIQPSANLEPESLYSVREVWFVSTCHLRQGNSCVRAPLRLRMTSIRIAHFGFVHRRGQHVVVGSRVIRPCFAYGAHWLFLLSRHGKAISAAANQKPFVNKDLCTRKSVKRTIKR